MGQKGTGLSDLPDFVHERTTLFNKTSFSKDAVLEYVQNAGEKHDKKNKCGSFATKWGQVVKCSLCEGNHDLDYQNPCLQFDLQESSKWLLLTIMILGIPKTERNAKFVGKDTEHLCMVLNQRKLRLNKQMVTPEKNRK